MGKMRFNEWNYIEKDNANFFHVQNVSWYIIKFTLSIDKLSNVTVIH